MRNYETELSLLDIAFCSPERLTSDCPEAGLQILEGDFGSPRVLGWFCFFSLWVKVPFHNITAACCNFSCLKKGDFLCLWISHVLFGMTF